MSGVNAVLYTDVFDGGLLLEHRSQPARSFLQNFMRDLYAGFSGHDVKRLVQNGTPKPCLMSAASEYWPVVGGFGFRNGSGAGGQSGVVLGSSDAAFDVNDYKLISEIAHGTSDGQLSRGATSFHGALISPDGESVSMRIERQFANASPSEVVVREVGLIGLPNVGGSSTTGIVCFSRDVLETPIVIAPGQLLGVQVVIKTEL